MLQCGKTETLTNHQLPVYKITDIYIKKDFRKINEANFKLIDFVFNDMEKEKSGTHQDKHSASAGFPEKGRPRRSCRASAE